MARVVLTADYTLMTDFREIPLATFFSCIPTDYRISRLVFRILAPEPPHDNGRAIIAPYGLRKIEASFLNDGFRREDVVVVLPDHVREFLGPDTEAVGLYEMDPLGLGPVSMSFTNGGRLTPYTKHKFFELMRLLNVPDRKFKIVMGGPGAWQFDYRPGMQETLGIDHIVHGECDHLAPEILRSVIGDRAPPVIRIPNSQAPRLEQIPPIVGPAMHGMVETMRGCGRGCQFCEVTLRRPRYFSYEFIRKELEVNARQGLTDANLHSDDVFLYRVEDYKTMMPNREALVELFKTAMSVPGIDRTHPTHGTVSAAVADPKMIEELSKVGRAAPERWIGIQCGLETGSRRLSEIIMPHKALPFKGHEWPDIVIQGTEILNRNYWFPAYTCIIGLPPEIPEDAWDTIDLIDRMEAIPNNHFIIAPLSFVPVGVLRGQEFYNTDEMLDEARFNVVYRCWRHILGEIDRNLWGFTRLPAPVRAVVTATGFLGGRYILRLLERYGERRGFRVRRPALEAASRFTRPRSRVAA